MPEFVRLHRKPVQLLIVFVMVPLACQRDRHAGSTDGYATTQPVARSQGPATTSFVRVDDNGPFTPRIDGHVVRNPLPDTVVVDVGMDDGVTQGTTFEVYDSQTGVPAGADAQGVPLGKATAEVVRIGPGYSECRIVRRGLRAINSGDPILRHPPSPSPLAVPPGS